MLLFVSHKIVKSILSGRTILLIYEDEKAVFLEVHSEMKEEIHELKLHLHRVNIARYNGQDKIWDMNED